MVKIIDKGPLWSYGGIPNSHREYLKQLSKKHKVWLTEFPDLAFGDEFIDMFNSFSFNISNHIMFLYGETDQWYKYSGHDCIGYNVYEGDNPPSNWINNMNNPHIKEIWVPSKYVKDVYLKKGIIKPIKIVPHGINKYFKPIKKKLKFKIINSKKITYLGIPSNNKCGGEDIFKDKFVFFGMGAIYGITERDRKGIDILLKSFENLFDDSVCLLLKLNIKYAKGYHQERDVKFDLENYLNKFINNKKNIYIIIQDLDEDNLIKLYNSVNCGVFPSRAEGFGMSQMEMIACGKPVITTEQSGTDDFSQEELRIKISKYKLAEFDNVDEQRVPYIGSKWSEPSISHLKKLMKKVIKNKEEYRKSAEKHGKYIHREFNWNKIGKEINIYIKEKYDYKNPTKTLCKNCLKNKKKIYMVQSEKDKLICPECYAWSKK